MNQIEDNSDNTNLINDESRTNNRRKFSIYWLEILMIFTIFIIIVLIIMAGIVGFTKGLHAFNLQVSLNSTMTMTTTIVTPGVTICMGSSRFDISCLLNVSHTSVSFSLNKKFKIDNNHYTYYSFEYTALSNLSIIMFSILKNSRFYLDDISVYDPSINYELIHDGSFDSGTMESYCSCGSDFSWTNKVKASTVASHTPSYGCEIDGIPSPVRISQVINTISSQQYNVSFWIKVPTVIQDFSLIVYMSSIVI